MGQQGGMHKESCTRVYVQRFTMDLTGRWPYLCPCPLHQTLHPRCPVEAEERWLRRSGQSALSGSPGQGRHLASQAMAGLLLVGVGSDGARSP